MAEPHGPIIVTAELARADQQWAEALRRAHYPPERNRVPAHITLFQHLPPSLEGELRALLKALTGGPPPTARIEGLRSLGRGVAIGLDSPDLLAIREHIAERFDRHLMPPERHRPRFHITIQGKVDERAAAATLATLKDHVTPRRTVIAALNCWRYHDGPWSAIARYPFRG